MAPRSEDNDSGKKARNLLEELPTGYELPRPTEGEEEARNLKARSEVVQEGVVQEEVSPGRRDRMAPRSEDNGSKVSREEARNLPKEARNLLAELLCAASREEEARNLQKTRGRVGTAGGKGRGGEEEEAVQKEALSPKSRAEAQRNALRLHRLHEQANPEPWTPNPEP